MKKIEPSDDLILEFARAINTMMFLRQDYNALQKKLEALLNYLNIEMKGGEVIRNELGDVEKISKIECIPFDRCDTCMQIIKEEIKSE